MRRKIITIVVCGLLLMSGIAMISKNIDVKAEAGSGNGNEVGINTTYIHSVAENLSKIVTYRNYPKGRTYGTEGEHYAAYLIKSWMKNQTGLSNVHMENITYGYNLAGYPKAIDKKVEDLSEGLIINNTNINKSEFFISPRYDLISYPFNQESPAYCALLTHNFSYDNVKIKQRPYHWALNYVIAWCGIKCKKLVDNGSIYNFDTFANFMFQEFAEYFNFSWEDMINDPLNTTITNNSQYNDFFNYSTMPTELDFLFIEQDPNFNPNPAPDLIPPNCIKQLFPDPESSVRLFWPYINLLFETLE